MLAKIVVKNVEELEYQMEQCWERVYTEVTCRKLYDSIPERLELVVKNGGARIRYLNFTVFSYFGFLISVHAPIFLCIAGFFPVILKLTFYLTP